jgi:two-component system sensor histidine kinase CiaH
LLLQMLVNNLLENAIKYSPKTAPINIALTQQNKQAIFAMLQMKVLVLPMKKRKKYLKNFIEQATKILEQQKEQA